MYAHGRQITVISPYNKFLRADVSLANAHIYIYRYVRMRICAKAFHFFRLTPGCNFDWLRNALALALARASDYSHKHTCAHTWKCKYRRARVRYLWSLSVHTCIGKLEKSARARTRVWILYKCAPKAEIGGEGEKKKAAASAESMCK